jgi:hypothetical protein
MNTVLPSGSSKFVCFTGSQEGASVDLRVSAFINYVQVPESKTLKHGMFHVLMNNVLTSAEFERRVQ